MLVLCVGSSSSHVVGALMSRERLGVECQLTGWCKMHVPWTCLEPAPHVALCTPRGWSPLPLRACAGRVAELGAPGWEGVELSAGNCGADSLGPLIATRFHAQLLHLPRPRAASGAPRRRCQTQSAPPAGQGGAHTGLPHSQLIVHSRQRRAPGRRRLGLPVGWLCLLPSQGRARPQQAWLSLRCYLGAEQIS